MRIIAGSLSGRIFESPKSLATHPMSERVRGGLFNSLGDISGLTVFDPFSGSGALSFEAVSRGASRVISLDNDKQAYQTIRTNIDILDVEDKVSVFLKQASSWMSGNRDVRFDVVLADPPYTDLRRDLLLRVAQKTTDRGIFVLSWPGSEIAPPFRDFSIIRQKSYGDAQLIFYRRTEQQ